MKNIKIQYTEYQVVSKLERPGQSTLLLVKRPKGKKAWLAYLYDNGRAKLSGELPLNQQPFVTK